MSHVTPLPTQTQRDPLDAIDLWLLLACLLLLAIGLVMVGSSSVTIAERYHGESLALLQRQGVFALISLLLAGATLLIPARFWSRHSALLLGIVILALIGVVIFGTPINGAKRWVRVFGFSVQFSEPAKVVFLLFVAAHLQRQGESASFAQQLTVPLILLGTIVGLLLLEPDFGAAAVLVATVLGLLFIASVKPWRLVGLAMVCVSIMAGIALLANYRMDRLTCFRDPLAQVGDCGYQLVQALIAVVRGDWFGVGLGDSVQKLDYLPEAHNDFLVAVLAEELGMLGVLVVLMLYAVVVWRCFAISAQAEQQRWPFGAYFSYAIGLLLAIQVLINIGVNLGVLPTKGLTLPLLSYGGSSLVVMCFALAVVLRIDFQLRRGVAGHER